jgi:hypothetical protein
MCFRFLDLRAAIKNGTTSDSTAILRQAQDLDRDLAAWKENIPRCWHYSTVSDNLTTSVFHFEGKQHLYHDIWAAQSWNNWRTLRILVNRIILQHQSGSDVELPILGLMKELSTDICISVSCFHHSPRKPVPTNVQRFTSGISFSHVAGTVSLIWPLTVMAQEQSNAYSMRAWAVNQLRRINSAMGFRQAGLLAEVVLMELRGPNKHNGGQ